MTKTELLKKILKETFYFLKAYFTNYLFPIIKDVIKDTRENFSEYIEEIKNYFIEALWSRIKDDIHEHLDMAIQEVNTFFASASYEMKEKIIIDYIFDHIHLPLLLRPSKFIAKKIFKKKVHEFIAEKLKDLHKLNQII